jgi:hypothetical protein
MTRLERAHLMDRMIRSRLSGFSIVLILALVLVGCGDVCLVVCMPSLVIGCFNLFQENLLSLPLCAGASLLTCSTVCGVDFSSSCAEDPDQCFATYEQLQLAAIEFCEEYPEACQQAFDTWVESLDAEAEE